MLLHARNGTLYSWVAHILLSSSLYCPVQNIIVSAQQER